MMSFKELYKIYWPQLDKTTGTLFIIIFIILLYSMVRICKNKKFTAMQLVCMGGLAIYIVLVLFSTVFTRPKIPQFKYNIEFFWSYRWGIAERGNLMIREIILNTLMLMPIGLLTPIIYRNICKKLFLFTFLFGFTVSFVIEILQLVLKRGLCEFDDLFHNTLGVVIGYFLYWLVWKLILYWKKKC